MKIALDAMGGDLAPKAAVEGAVRAARDFAINVVLVGDRPTVERELTDHDVRNLPITLEHAAQTVAMDDSPLESVLGKPESSIHVGLELVKRGEADAFVSAGNSGAVMATAMAVLGNLPGIDRPAIASVVPTTAGLCLLIDAGANTDVKPLNLMQFGVMGSVYWKHVGGVPTPRVAILANGEEASKGSEATRSAATGLAAMAPALNYIGYVEGRDLNSAKADVIVTDGFTGNVALKTMEGFATFLLANLREVFESGLVRKLAFLLIRKRLLGLRSKLDPSEYGGAPLLGVGGVVIIAHGSSNPHAIRNAIRAAANESLVRNVNTEISELVARIPVASALKPANPNKGIRGLFLKMRDRLHLPHPQRDAASEAKPGRTRDESAPRSDSASPARSSEGRPEVRGSGALKSLPTNGPVPTPGDNGLVRDASHQDAPETPASATPSPSATPPPKTPPA